MPRDDTTRDKVDLLGERQVLGFFHNNIKTQAWNCFIIKQLIFLFAHLFHQSSEKYH